MSTKTHISLGPEVEALEIKVIRDSFDSELLMRFIKELRTFILESRDSINSAKEGIEETSMCYTDMEEYIASIVHIFDKKIKQIDEVLKNGIIR